MVVSVSCRFLPFLLVTILGFQLLSSTSLSELQSAITIGTQDLRVSATTRDFFGDPPTKGDFDRKQFPYDGM